MITDNIKALLGDELAQQVETALKGKGKNGTDLDLVAGNDGSYIPTDAYTQLEGQLATLRKTTALRLCLGDAHDPDDIISRLNLDALELDDKGNPKTDIAELVKPIRESKPYLFRAKETGASELNLKGAVPGQVGGGGGESVTEQALNDAFDLKGE